MIHIDVRRIPRKDIAKLIEAADAAQGEIDAENSPERRRKLIAKHRPKWVAFRPCFEALSHGKCWYTESINPGSDDDVDHFRPKGNVAEDKEHGGYYWLALTWRNFRLSCHRANRLRENPATKKAHGKAEHFPLFDPACRARTPTDDLARERPLLLDPTDPFDPPKLTFKPDGTVAVAPRYETDADAVKQVEASRLYLHLDWPAFVDQRTQLFNQIAFKIEEGQEHAKRAEAGDPGSQETLKTIAADLVGLTKEDRPYSAAVHAYIALHRDTWWVRDVVLRVPAVQEAT